MALEGQLSDFNLAEIMQLLASQQKSGFLNLEAQREMVFVFDKGALISTRDRRSRSRDPLEAFLQAYGFFGEGDWKHIEYVRANSSLDLTEILISEGLMNEAELKRALHGVAQEMVTAGMKLRHGRYNFAPTKDTPPGVKWRLSYDVQGLLMESARRLDEEPLLKEFLPSQSICFAQGAKVLPPGDLGEVGTRVMELALGGMPLGRIIRQGRAESFVVRDLLKNWCEEGILKKVEPQDHEDGGPVQGARKRQGFLKYGLRNTPLTLLALALLAVTAWARGTLLDPPDPAFGRHLRVAQIRNEVVSAAWLFRHQEGQWPESLAELVRNGQLPVNTLGTVKALGWVYTVDTGKDQFTLG
ncbi:MAG: DUF4388 domain-containing protein [Candidatus Krumholzibacteriia bacterium]